MKSVKSQYANGILNTFREAFEIKGIQNELKDNLIVASVNRGATNSVILKLRKAYGNNIHLVYCPSVRASFVRSKIKKILTLSRHCPAKMKSLFRALTY